MNIQKFLSQESPPYDPSSNYTVTFTINNPKLMDFSKSYINIPLNITESGNIPNCVANVQLGNEFSVTSDGSSTIASTAMIRNVKVECDGNELIYVPFYNRLNSSLAMYSKNVTQERLYEFLSASQENISYDLLTQYPINASVFRNLYNSGDTRSERTVGFIRVNLSDLLAGFANSIRNLSNYSELKITITLDDFNYLITESFHQNNISSTISGITNTYTLAQLGIAAIAGVGAAGTFTTTATYPNVESFIFGVGDVLTTNAGGGRTITAVAMAGNNIILSAGAFTAGDTSILVTNVPLKKVFVSTGKTIEQWAVIKENYNEFIMNDLATHLTLTPTTLNMGLSQFVTGTNNILSYFYPNLDGDETPPANFNIGRPPLLLDSAANATIVANTPITTIEDFSTRTFPFWVGELVYVSGSANITEVFTLITDIQYSLGKAVLRFANDIVIAGGAVANLCIFHFNSNTLTASLNNKFEIVTYNFNPSLNIPTSNKFGKWKYDGDVIPTLSANQIYEKTFMIPPLTVVSCILINRDNAGFGNDRLVSNMYDLQSYRILIDGVDTTSRELLLNADTGDQSYKYERLITGFTALDYLVLNCLDPNPLKNPLSNDGKAYVIMQLIPYDEKPHNLTISLRNSSATFTSKSMRLYNYVVSQF